MHPNIPDDVAEAIAAADAGEASPGAPGALVFTLSLAMGGLWIVGVSAAAIVLLGADVVTHLTPVQIAALAGAAFLPACMAVFSGATAREGARARAEARRLADAADRLLSPAQSAQASTHRLVTSVRAEITTLDNALEHTISRLREVEGLIGRQVQTVDDMGAQAKVGAGNLIVGMERERDELMKISRDLNAQAQSISGSISKHTTVIAEAARMAEQEVRAADQALDHRLTSFGAAAALITDRTQALSGAAQASADSALRLETALSNALDVLAKATNLTDAARESADAAAVAANSTAGAVRDTTNRAVEDAKRAAELIRGEAVNVEREASAALERLRDAAEAARSAAIGARTAIESDIPRRSRPPVMRAETPRPAPEQNYEEQDEWRDEPPLSDYRRSERDPTPPRRRSDEGMFGDAPPNAPAPGNWTWRDLLSNVDQNAPAEPQRAQRQRTPAPDPIARLSQTISEPRATGPALPAAQMIDHAGLRLNEVFSGSALDRIAQRARAGTQARRRAVREAAPDAVSRLAAFLASNAQANQEALQFLRNDGARIAELLARGRAAMGAEATRAFLLIDSAAG